MGLTEDEEVIIRKKVLINQLTRRLLKIRIISSDSIGGSRDVATSSLKKISCGDVAEGKEGWINEGRWMRCYSVMLIDVGRNCDI